MTEPGKTFGEIEGGSGDRDGGSGTAPEPPNLGSSGKRGKRERYDFSMDAWQSQPSSGREHDQSEPNSSAIRCPKPLRRLQQRRPVTLGAYRASIRVRNDIGRLSPGPALTPSRCSRLLRQAATSRSAANSPPNGRAGYRRATLAPKHRPPGTANHLNSVTDNLQI